MGRVEEAITAHGHDLAICRDVGDRHGEGMAWNNFGLALAGVARFDEAIGAYQCHIAICAKLGDQYGQARTLENLGTVHAELDQPKRARRAWTDTIEFYAAAGAEDDADRVRQAIAQLGGGPAADDLVIERAIGAGDALTSS